ncbi:MAG: hypothetical protein QW514_08470 [Thermoprotei archaeon]
MFKLEPGYSVGEALSDVQMGVLPFTISTSLERSVTLAEGERVGHFRSDEHDHSLNSRYILWPRNWLQEPVTLFNYGGWGSELYGL